jgi:hypothetical protein
MNVPSDLDVMAGAAAAAAPAHTSLCATTTSTDAQINKADAQLLMPEKTTCHTTSHTLFDIQLMQLVSIKIPGFWKRVCLLADNAELQDDEKIVLIKAHLNGALKRLIVPPPSASGESWASFEEKTGMDTSGAPTRANVSAMLASVGAKTNETHLVLPDKPSPLALLLARGKINLSLLKFACQKAPGLGKRLSLLTCNSELKDPEKLVLIQAYLTNVMNVLTLPPPLASSESSDKPSRRAQPQSACSSVAAPITTTCAASAGRGQGLRRVADGGFVPAWRMKCSKKEGRCIGYYSVLSNGKFHGAHNNTGCSGVPVEDDGARKRKLRAERSDND